MLHFNLLIAGAGALLCFALLLSFNSILAKVESSVKRKERVEKKCRRALEYQGERGRGEANTYTACLLLLLLLIIVVD